MEPPTISRSREDLVRAELHRLAAGSTVAPLTAVGQVVAQLVRHGASVHICGKTGARPKCFLCVWNSGVRAQGHSIVLKAKHVGHDSLRDAVPQGPGDAGAGPAPVLALKAKRNIRRVNADPCAAGCTIFAGRSTAVYVQDNRKFRGQKKPGKLLIAKHISKAANLDLFRSLLESATDLVCHQDCADHPMEKYRTQEHKRVKLMYNCQCPRFDAAGVRIQYGMRAIAQGSHKGSLLNGLAAWIVEGTLLCEKWARLMDALRPVVHKALDQSAGGISAKRMEHRALLEQVFGLDDSMWPLPGLEFTSGFIGSGNSKNHFDKNAVSGTLFVVVPLFDGTGASAFVMEQMSLGFVLESGDVMVLRGDQVLHGSTVPCPVGGGPRLVMSLWIDKNVLSDIKKHGKDALKLARPYAAKGRFTS